MDKNWKNILVVLFNYNNNIEIFCTLSLFCGLAAIFWCLRGLSWSFVVFHGLSWSFMILCSLLVVLQWFYGKNACTFVEFCPFLLEINSLLQTTILGNFPSMHIFMQMQNYISLFVGKIVEFCFINLPKLFQLKINFHNLYKQKIPSPISF